MTQPADTSEYTPSTREVASYIKNRTVDAYNNFIGDFTDDTIVTGGDVTRIIDQAEELVLRRLKLPPAVDPSVPVPPLPEQTVEAIKNLIALLAASMVELNKFSEQIATGRSAYPYLKELFDEMLGWLATDILGEAPGDQAGHVSIWDLVASQSGIARFDFPVVPDNVSWATKF